MAKKNKNNLFLGKKINNPFQQKTKALLLQKWFPRTYLLISVVVLFLSTIFWSVLSSIINVTNGSQLINTLSLNKLTLNPEHTLLIKWPIYYLLQVFGTTKNSLIVFSTLAVLLTIGLFVLILRSIEKRPLYLGTICLALASVLMFVPALSYPGAFGTVNMAMIASRNLEYVLYIFSLQLMIKAPKLKSNGFWLSLILMALLIISDRIFLIISLGGAIVAMIYYGFAGKVALDSLISRWLIKTLLGALAAIVFIWLITTVKISHTLSQVGYLNTAITNNISDLIHGAFYAITSILTNLGANPAATANSIHHVPKTLFANLFSISVVGFVVNFLVVILGIVLVYRLLKNSSTKSKNKKSATKKETLAILLIWSAIASLIFFTVTSHNYLHDANYTTIILFAVFVSIAVFVSTKKYQPETLVLAGLIFCLGALSGINYVWNSYRADMTAMNYRDNQNQLITNVLKQHSVKTLVGYSAQVEAIKLNNLSNINILPMQNCFQPITLLQNTQWQPELKDASFAYIFSLQQTNDGYTNCSFQQFEKIYGEPNSQVLISGSVANPKAFLFFYNKGFHKLPVLKKTSIRSIINNVAPLPLAVLTAPTCSGATTLVMVAHEDDDLLFMNPDINSQIQSGDCVRVVYLTAGDDGGAAFYWLDRQEGSETAYSTMIGQMNNWIERTVEIAPNEYATLATPSDNSKVSLLFMHLPDGNLAGQGFKTYGYQSIHKLYSGTIGTINSVDGQSHYTKPQLTGALSTIINFYKPNQLWTQSSYVDSSADHSDHGTTGKFATAAVLGSNNTSLSTTYYMGYQMNALPSDLNQTDQSNKQTIFKQYAEHDPNICEGTTLCLNLSTYKNYIFREYTWAY